MKLLIFGYGYCARHLVKRLKDLPRDALRVTTRSQEKADDLLRKQEITARVFPGHDMQDDLGWATHVLITAGPTQAGDPVLAELGDSIVAAAPKLTWVGYLSTTGVYGDHAGGWVDEDTALTPSTARGHARVSAEAAWRALHETAGLPLHIFRLAGIYGPGRGPFSKVRAGTARRIIKPGQVFSRCHVDDIAQVLAASMNAPRPGRIYNICDDDPAPPQDVIAYAAERLGVAIPPDVPFAEAELTPMARSFYAESKRVRNDRIKDELGIHLIYPDYRSGLDALLSAEDETPPSA